MKLGIISSAWEGTDVDAAKGIKIIKDIGYDTIDIQEDPLELDVKTKISIIDTCRSINLPIISVATTDLGLIDPNKALRKFSLKRCRAFLDLVYEFRAKNFLLCMGNYFFDGKVIDKEEQWEYGVEALKELGKFAQDLGVEIALEMTPWQNTMLNSFDNMARFLDDVDMPAVNANFDISHVFLLKLDLKDIDKIKDRIIHAHVSDCDGTRHSDQPPGRGVIDFKPYFKVLKDIGYNGTVSVELEYAPEGTDMVDWVREAYESTKSFMEEIGARD